MLPLALPRITSFLVFMRAVFIDRLRRQPTTPCYSILLPLSKKIPDNLSVAGYSHTVFNASPPRQRQRGKPRGSFVLVEILFRQLFVEAINVIAKVRMTIGVGPGSEIY